MSCILFAAKNLNKEEIIKKKVLEVGSYNINGSIRPLIESWKPKEYIGVDIIRGVGVDFICDANNLIEKFGKNSFDVVIATEVLEHVKDWKRVISNIKNVCKPNGIILITVRSYGFHYHPFSYDFWRFELNDMKNIFSDCNILTLERDDQAPGVFIKIKKPDNFFEKDLTGYKLYNILMNKKIDSTKTYINFHFVNLVLKAKIRDFLLKIGKSIWEEIK